MTDDFSTEQAVLGGMLIGNGTIVPEVLEILNANDFFKPAHGRIFEVIAAQFSAGLPTDTVSIKDALQKRRWLTNVGGAPYLLELTQTVPTAVNSAHYARIVKDQAKLRRLAEVGARFQQLAVGDIDEVDALISQAEAMFRELGEPAKSGLMWNDLVNRWQNWQEIQGDVIPSPWFELNQRLPGGGFSPGQLVIVGGRPAQGKSNAGLNIALCAAENHGRLAIVFSVEMDANEICSRLLAAGTYSEVRQLFAKKMDEKTAGKINSYIEQSKTMPLEVVDQPWIRVEQIVSHCRIRRPKIIFVDYTQLVAPTDSRVIREQQVAHVLRSLKVAAKQLQMVVIAASQLKRRDDSDRYEPKLSDLRESGAAEQDADIVLLLDRAPNAANMKVLVAKNRNGSTGDFLVKFRGDLARLI
jgi:replicative DNA helicase